ncbi:DUF3325 domain-containing protein [Caulobacter sp.]|jgi:hypothetical protein|uniref:DUF3325 family protein n=1 Tax=Caulobacter sp. TaxID=78 RepID=UPI00160A3C11
MIVLALLLSLVGFATLALAMDRHHQAVHRTRPDKRRKHLMQLGGATALTLSLVASVVAWGPAYGVIGWLGVLSAGAAPVLLILTYAPHRLAIRRKP